MSFLPFFKGTSNQKLQIGNGAYNITIPKKYLWEYDNENTLLFYPRGPETITIRVSVISFSNNDGKPGDGADYVIKEALAKGYNYEVASDKTAYMEIPPKRSIENGVNLIMQFWYIGRENSLIIFSAATIVLAQNDKTVTEMKSDLAQILKSVKKG